MSDQRRTSRDHADGAANERPNAKGRPTPSRRDAQAARKAQMKRPLTRREQAARKREARSELSKQRREAYATGDGPGLSARDSGPVKRYVRDVIDTRRRVSEFMLPLLVSILVLSALPFPWAARVANAVWAATMVTVIFELFVVNRTLKKGITARYGADEIRGTRFYGLMRLTQPRFLRSPRPGIKPGQPPRT